MHGLERRVREQILVRWGGDRHVGRDGRRGRLIGELPLEELSAPVVDGAVADHRDEPAWQPFVIDPIEPAMQLQEGVRGDFFGHVAPADGPRGGPQDGRQVATIDGVERHGPGPPAAGWTCVKGGRQVYDRVASDGLNSGHVLTTNEPGSTAQTR